MAYFWNYPLRKESNKLQASMLAETPVGMKFNEVIKILGPMNYNLKVSKNAGFLKQEKGQSQTVGVSSIRAHLGDYWTFPFFRISVTVFWGFDKDDKLIEIWVWKTTDGP